MTRADRPTAAVDEYLVPLKQLGDYEVADDSADVRGWPVHSADDRRIGMVDDLLVDTRDLKARYLMIDREHVEPDAGPGRMQLIFPVSTAVVEYNQRKVRVAITSAQVDMLPPYSGSGSIRPGYPESFGRNTMFEPPDTSAEKLNERQGTRSAEHLRFRKRGKPARKVRVSDTHNVEGDVRHERVEVERSPSNEAADVRRRKG